MSSLNHASSMRGMETLDRPPAVDADRPSTASLRAAWRMLADQLHTSAEVLRDGGRALTVFDTPTFDALRARAAQLAIQTQQDQQDRTRHLRDIDPHHPVWACAHAVERVRDNALFHGTLVDRVREGGWAFSPAALAELERLYEALDDLVYWTDIALRLHADGDDPAIPHDDELVREAARFAPMEIDAAQHILENRAAAFEAAHAQRRSNGQCHLGSARVYRDITVLLARVGGWLRDVARAAMPT